APPEPLAGQPPEDVRAQRPVLRLDRALLEKVAVGDHPRHLDHVAQLDLAPRAPCTGALQRRDEVARLLAQRAHALAQLAQHLRELALGVPALALQPADLALHAPELLRHRAHQSLDLLRPAGHLPGGALLLGAARLFQAPRQRVAGLRENVDGDRRQLIAQALALL